MLHDAGCEKRILEARLTDFRPGTAAQFASSALPSYACIPDWEALSSRQKKLGGVMLSHLYCTRAQIFIIAVGILVSGAQIACAQSYYAAIAYSQSTGKIGATYREARTEQAAQDIAVRNC